MNVDGRTRQRHRIAKRFHAIDQISNAICLVANQLDQFPVASGSALLQELSGSSNPCERILDFMRHYGAHAAHRACSPTVEQLAVNTLGQGSFLQKYDHRTLGLGGKR